MNYEECLEQQNCNELINKNDKMYYVFLQYAH